MAVLRTTGPFRTTIVNMRRPKPDKQTAGKRPDFR